ncbi:hypothetical protein PRZ48_000330 [Zasmidium cellare]|uniref:RNA helicase n=1 Tax=Zasmidium cellare TaxID=395010 RepID=A0ABR0EZF4_ZASCE|nr:hypothetical protein PRZ48_000330 [Zasmidium cellare]
MSGTKRKLARKAPSPDKKRKTNLDALRWKEVSLPDRLEDYEGFFGLEEVENVDVVRDPHSGIISYKSTTDQAAGAEHGNDDGDSWEGFSDDDEVEVKSEPKAKSKPAADPQKNGKVKANEKPTSTTTTFAGLENIADGEDTDVSAWQPLKLSPDTMAALAKLNFTKPTPIQESVIPEAFEGHDVIGKASTGSGKTLAFGIPILERFLEKRSTTKPSKKAPIALILSPTRELAHQLNKHLGALFAGVTTDQPALATLTGGLSLQKQQRLLKDADVVIGTPGRLWEIISSGQGVGSALKRIEYLVIDEADRLLSEGHFKEVEDILNTLDRIDTNDEDDDASATPASSENRQTLVFSATFDRGLQKKLSGKQNRKQNLLGNKETMEYLLSKLNFREDDPKFIDVNPIHQMASGLKEGVVQCGDTEKDLYLYALLLLQQPSRAMIFTNSIDAVRRITPFLQNLNLNALALHSGMEQKARLRSVERFSAPTKSSVVLVATDVAARGLDIPNVDLVVHYHLPRAADAYIHRSGRTARAGAEGYSVLICGPGEVAKFRRLVAQVHAKSAMAKLGKRGYFVRTLNVDRKIVSRLKERAHLAKILADAPMAKEKQRKEDDELRRLADEADLVYDSDEFKKESLGGKRGRGAGRKKKEQELGELTKKDLGAMRAQLKELLSKRVNTGVSEKYLASGRVDVNELLRDREGGKTGEFLGTVDSLWD